MAGAKEHFPRWQPWVLCALRRCRRSSRPRCRCGACVVRWLEKGEPMPAWILPSPEGTALEKRNGRTVFVRLLAKADMRQIGRRKICAPDCALTGVYPRQTPWLTGRQEEIRTVGQIFETTAGNMIRCVSALFQRTAFQACSFNHSDISPL